MAEKEKVVKKPLYERPGMMSVLVSLSAVLLGVVAGCILILCIGKNPIEGFDKIIFGALSNTRRVGNTVAYSTQLILIGLSVAFAFKTGLFNIGGSGQMLIGGIAASVFAHKVTFLPSPIYYVCLVLVAALAGALWGFVPGLLKAKFNVHEVVGTIMFNWIAYWLCYDGIQRWIVDPKIVVKSSPVSVGQSLRSTFLTRITGGSYFNYGILIAIICVVVIWFILDKTNLGFALKATGSNRFCAEYAGIKVESSIMSSMAIAGALAGLAGLTYYLGYSNIMEIGKMPGEGFDGIAVALLGNSNPFGVFFAGLFFGILKMGKGSLSATGIPPEIADAIIATIIYFTATSVILTKFWTDVLRKRHEKKLAKSTTGKEE